MEAESCWGARTRTDPGMTGAGTAGTTPAEAAAAEAKTATKAWNNQTVEFIYTHRIRMVSVAQYVFRLIYKLKSYLHFVCAEKRRLSTRKDTKAM